MIAAKRCNIKTLKQEDDEDVEASEEKDEDIKTTKKINDVVNISRQTSVPLLFAALHEGNIQTVREILEQTTEFINSSAYGGLTPLHNTCHMQQLDILKLLISRGAKVDCLDSLGNTELHVAVTEKWYDGIAELLRQGASPNKLRQPPNTVCGVVKETALHSAVRIGDKTSTALLLEVQPDLHIRDSSNCSVLHLAASTRNLAILKLLLAEVQNLKQLKDIEKDGYSLLHAALSGEKLIENESQVLKVIQVIHKFCDNMNHVNLLGETPLILACRAGLSTVVKFFLDNEADPALLTHERQSTLHATCISGCSTTLLHLLSTNRVGHLISFRDSNGYSPFYFAIKSASVDCCKTLLENGEHLTHISKGGMTNCSLAIQKLPSVMQLFRDLFDSGIKLSKKPQYDPDFSITFDYSALMSSEKQMQSSIVSKLADTPLETLIKHPLLESFLYIKWCRIRRIFYYNVLQFFLYLLLHSAFVMLTFGHDRIDWSQNPNGLQAFQLIHLLFLLFVSIPAIFIIIANYKNYLQQWETYTRLAAMMFSAYVIFTTYASPAETSAFESITDNMTTVNTSSLAETPDFQRIPANMTTVNTSNTEVIDPSLFASMSMLCGWVELMMLLGRFPSLGAYILMFTRVSKSLIKFILSFLSLLIGFSLCFHIRFQYMPVFANYELSFAKTLMMMTGEIAYSEFVHDKDVQFPRYNLIILSIFLFMVTVIMSNLLIALAVNDIPELKRKGRINRLVKEASYLMAYENLIVYISNLKFFPRKLKKMLLSKCNIKSVITIWPNKAMKRYGQYQIIPVETMKEAITLGSCENSEDFPIIVEEDINQQMKTFQIKYSSDRRTQKHRFSDIAELCNNIQMQINQLQHNVESQLSHISLQLQRNQDVCNHQTQRQPDRHTLQKWGN